MNTVSSDDENYFLSRSVFTIYHSKQEKTIFLRALSSRSRTGCLLSGPDARNHKKC